MPSQADWRKECRPARRSHTSAKFPPTNCASAFTKSIATWASEIGARRARQSIPLSEVVQAIVLTKENLWEFLKSESVMDRAVEIMGELELLQMLEMFFDRAIYYAALGYEEEVAGEWREEGAVRTV
jgi:hypothetical protein